MKIHQLTVSEAFASLQSGPEGLSESEAARRRVEFGPNELAQVRRKSLIRRFAKGLAHFFAIVLWLAAALAFFAEIREPGQGMATLGFAIVGVILINAIFSFWQEYRAEKALAALQQLLPRQVKASRDRTVMPIPIGDVVPGDLLLLEAGDNVPADCRVVEAFGLRVNNATITGESLPHSRDAGISQEVDFIQSNNVLLAGTSVVSGETTALAFATGQHTAFGQIAHLTQSTVEPLSPLQKEVVRLSRLVAALSLGLGMIFFFIGRAIGLPFWSNFIFAIGIIVANVPEGLLPTLTLALAMGSQRMARRNALVRHLPAVETLGAATVICTDKTGTLTKNEMWVRRVFVGGALFEVENLSDLPPVSEPLLTVAKYCHTLRRSQRNGCAHWLGDPLEIALVEMAESVAPGWAELPCLSEIPFDSKRRRLTTIHQTPSGLRLLMKGAPEVVLPLCESVHTAEGL